MARYCFYCGRELKTGEKCNCRQHRSSTSAKSGHEQNGEEKRPETGQNKTKKHKVRFERHNKSSWRQSLRSFFSVFTAGSRKKQSNSQYQGPYTSKNKPASSNAGSYFARGLKIIGSYITRPAELIRVSAQADSRQPVMAFVFFHSISGGLLLLLSTEQNRLADLLSLNFVTAQQGQSLLSRFYIFFQGFSIFLVSSLLLIFLYQFIIRYILRQSIGLIRLFTGMSAAYFYSGIFLLFSTLLIRSSFFSATLMLMAAFTIHILVQSISLPAVTGLDDNRIFILLITVLMLYTGIMALILNLALPVIDVLLEQVIII